jgi:hypothetical protein
MGNDRGWIQPGFPRRILLDDDQGVVDADPLLPRAAAFLDEWPGDREIDAPELASGLDIPVARAAVMLEQLHALGFTGDADATGERPVFDPDGATQVV